jgi:large subunit ribosomal protein L4e
MATRPLVAVYTGDEKDGKAEQHVTLPHVFTTPIRPDIINDIHTLVRKNKRQPYAVSKYAGHQTSAESWGTGRAVARIPRVPGGGTHRAGQGAFGNMCRGGRMFAPTKIWRRWHVKVNKNQRRYALTSALAASAVPSLVLARGHKIENVPEIPLVVESKAINTIEKTKKAVDLLKKIGAFTDVVKAKDSKKLRAGKGKMRNRRFKQRLGPLVIFKENAPLVKAFRNLPGVTLCNVRHLNLLQVAPGGHLGRFIIWTKDAFEELDKIYGTATTPSSKVNYSIPKPMITNPDILRILGSDEVQSKLRPRKEKPKKMGARKNPLANRKFKLQLNPYAQTTRDVAEESKKKASTKRAELIELKRKGQKLPSNPKLKEKRGISKKNAKPRKQFYETLLK